MTVTATVLLHRLVARGKFRHIQVLLKLAELGSVQRAAEAIGLTQSSVTQTLAYLESLLGTRLFTRHARGVMPTPLASQLVPVARDDIFPGDQLLGHAPALIRELAAFVRAPAQDTIAANAVVTARATELGRLRHAQRASVHQVLRELKEDRNNPSAWTPYNANLGRRIYKGGGPGDLYSESGGGYD